MKLTIPPPKQVSKTAFLKYLYTLLRESIGCSRAASHHLGGGENYRGSGEGQRKKKKKAPFSNRDYFHFNITGSEQRGEKANTNLFFFFFLNVNILCIRCRVLDVFTAT